MKNILLKSLSLFIIMSFLNFVFSVLILSLTDVSGGNFGMFPFFILIECLIISVIGIITVLIFKKHYSSIMRAAVLFEILYVLVLIISGINPFLFFFERESENLFSFLLYVNSLIAYLIIYLFVTVYPKIMAARSEN
ncbi:hypothetical protein [Chryseobacterium gossypii]|uniref:hypothetical protein n=1 Tax=Chryseobacterium gossypii TaxID=3231602 RepID=UPI0035253EBB